MTNTEALELVQKCLDDWPYAATRVVDIMTRLEKVKELLKEQEAVEPKHNPLSPTDWFCGKCGMCISRFHDYCPSCGHAVKWE